MGIKNEINYEITKTVKKLVDNIGMWGFYNEKKMEKEQEIKVINNQLKSLANENIKLNKELVRLQDLYESLENGGK